MRIKLREVDNTLGARETNYVYIDPNDVILVRSEEKYEKYPVCVKVFLANDLYVRLRKEEYDKLEIYLGIAETV